MGFSENFRDELQYQGIQVKEFSQKTGISINTLDKYRPGSSVLPNVDTAYQIANALGVTVEYLVKGVDSNNHRIPVKSEILQIEKSLYHFSEEDLKIISAIVETFKLKYQRRK